MSNSINKDTEYYYAGEFGFFNVILLPILEKYNGKKLSIHTFPDYCYIIRNLFGNKFDCSEIKLAKLRLFNNCIENEDYKIKYKSIETLLKCGEIWQMNNFDKISKAITTNFIPDEDISEFICYFPRFRDSGTISTNFALRNSTNSECEYILNLLNQKYKTIILGKETLKFDYTKYNTSKIEDIEKSIYYLKKCKFLISNDSGYIDFAKNCGCKNIIIIRPIEDYHFKFNPFNSSLYNIDKISQLESLI
jgi:hypothetical protein